MHTGWYRFTTVGKRHSGVENMSHKYKHKKHTNGFEYSSVTTIISACVNKADALMPWSARMVCEWIRQNCESQRSYFTKAGKEIIIPDEITSQKAKCGIYFAPDPPKNQGDING